MQNRKRDTHTHTHTYIYIYNSLLDSVGEGEGGMFSENSIETCILSTVKQIASPDLKQETSAQGWCTLIKKFFSSSLSAISMVSSAYLRLLIFLPAFLIPAYASSSPAFLMMYPVCKLNKQGDNIQP